MFLNLSQPEIPLKVGIFPASGNVSTLSVYDIGFIPPGPFNCPIVVFGTSFSIPIVPSLPRASLFSYVVGKDCTTTFFNFPAASYKFVSLIFCMNPCIGFYLTVSVIFYS